MPRLVDHDGRRREIISHVWRLIADEGLDAVTTRRIAERTGYANGLLRYYFPGKDSVIEAAFQHVLEATNLRAEASEGANGLAGLRLLALEILPLDDERLAEARVVLAFWQHALQSPAEAAQFARGLEGWRIRFTQHLAYAEGEGDLRPGVDHRAAVDELMALLMGAQALGVLTPEQSGPERQRAQLDSFLAGIARRTDPSREINHPA